MDYCVHCRVALCDHDAAVQRCINAPSPRYNVVIPAEPFQVIKLLPFQSYLSIAVVCDGPAGDAFKRGTVHEGLVQNIQSFGAIIDFNGLTGLLHISDITHKKVDAVDAIFKVGDKV